MVRSILTGLLTLMVLTAMPAFAQREGLPLTQGDKAFLLKLKKAVNENDRKWIAAHVRFPIQPEIDGHVKTIKGKKQFLNHYNDIFNCYVKGAIEKEKPDALFKRWDGVMIGNGEVWFSAFNSKQAAALAASGVGKSKEQQADVYYQITGINNSPAHGWWSPVANDQCGESATKGS